LRKLLIDSFLIYASLYASSQWRHQPTVASFFAKKDLKRENDVLVFCAQFVGMTELMAGG